MTDIFLTHAPEVRANYYSEHTLEQLQALGTVRLNDSPTLLSLDELVERADGCRIIVASREAAAPSELFERLPQLAAICRVAVDIRNIDVNAANKHGVLVTRATPGFDTSVSEWVIGVMIDLARGISCAAADYWQCKAPKIVMGRELRGATLGIVGYGFIGRRLAEIARLLQMRVLVSDPMVAIDEPGVEQASFDHLVQTADYVVCLAPAVEQTQNLFRREVFQAMRRDAFFINASRGELVDERDLLEALDHKLIAGCALDVGRALDQMPSSGLASHPRLIATPHIGGLTPEASQHQAMDTVRQVKALLAGQVPAGAVNLQHATRACSLFGLQQ